LRADLNDRHVAATAVTCGSQGIVTEDLEIDPGE